MISRFFEKERGVELGEKEKRKRKRKRKGKGKERKRKGKEKEKKRKRKGKEKEKKRKRKGKEKEKKRKRKRKGKEKKRKEKKRKEKKRKERKGEERKTKVERLYTLKRLVHTVSGTILSKDHIVFRDSDDKNKGIQSLEERGPIVTLRTLTSSIQNDELVTVQHKLNTLHTSGHLTGTQDIGVLRNVVGSSNTVQVFEKEVRRVIRLEVSLLLESLLDGGGLPDLFDNLTGVTREIANVTVLDFLQEFLITKIRNMIGKESKQKYNSKNQNEGLASHSILKNQNIKHKNKINNKINNKIKQSQKESQQKTESTKRKLKTHNNQEGASSLSRLSKDNTN